MLKKGDQFMHKKLILSSVRMLFLVLIIVIPRYLYAFDPGDGDIIALDKQTFIVTREFAGEIRLYLCSVEDGRIFIKDSGSIPYMTMDHRNLGKPAGREILPGNNESPIIKTVP